MKLFLKSNTLDLSVAIASLNEAPNLCRSLPIIREMLEGLGISWEILVIDGDSRDGTKKVVEDAGARYVCEPALGYGTAIMRGISEARGEYVQTMDADLSHPAGFIPQIWEARTKGDLVIASRYVPGGHANQPWFRYTLSRALNRFFSVGLSVPVRDMSSGFRLYRKSMFEGMDLRFTNFVLLIEILLQAYGKGLQIVETPFQYELRGTGTSKARILKFGMDYLRLFYRVWRIRNSIDFPDYDWRAYDSRIPLQRKWQRKRHAIIQKFTPAFVSTCDVGCGTSRILVDLPHAIGVDMRHDKLTFMRRTNNRLVQANGMTLPFADDSFGCIICSQVIEHIPEENGRLIDELERLLEPGGTLILGTPDYGRWQWRIIERIYGMVVPGAYADEHVTHYTYDSLADALRERGLEIEHHEYICNAELIMKVRKPARE